MAQAWRNPARQARLGRILRADGLEVEALDLELAKAAGQLCGATGTSDIIDASVALAARSRGAAVVTSDPDGIRNLIPSLTVAAC